MYFQIKHVELLFTWVESSTFTEYTVQIYQHERQSLYTEPMDTNREHGKIK